MMTQNTTIFQASILILKKKKARQTGSDWGVDDLPGDHAKTDEPSAEEEWLKECEQQQAEKRERLKSLTDRLNFTTVERLKNMS